MNLKHLSPLFIWIGGKRSEIKKYIQYIPDDIDTYLEPFVGGGATYFHLNHNKNVISDPYAPRFRGNHGVTAFWRGIYGVSTG